MSIEQELKQTNQEKLLNQMLVTITGLQDRISNIEVRQYENKERMRSLNVTYKYSQTLESSQIELCDT